MPKNKKTILVTGGAGFVGSHLCESLLQDGHRIICIDNFYSGSKANIAVLLKNKNFVFLKHDIIRPLRKNLGRIDEIYNLACPASPVHYQSDPIFTLRTNIDGIENMLALARKNKAKLLQASTSEVYGDPLKHPQCESYFGNVDALGKRSCYDEGKRVAETYCKEYSVKYGMDVRIVRLFNIYGPRMLFNDGRVVSNFIYQALGGKDITVHGKGDQSRSFMYIDDLIIALKKMMTVAKDKIGYFPVNLGNPDERTIGSLAKDIKRLTGSKSKITFIDYKKISSRLGDPQKRCPDISRAKKILNWKPKIGFEAGLLKTISDFEQRIERD